MLFGIGPFWQKLVIILAFLAEIATFWRTYPSNNLDNFSQFIAKLCLIFEIEIRFLSYEISTDNSDSV